MYPVYILHPDSQIALIVKKGSGIVGQPESVDQQRFIGFYEGNVYQAENIKTYEDKLYHAADRMIHNYPTKAKIAVTHNEVTRVGYFDYESKVFHPEPGESAKQALNYWIGS